MLKLTKLDPFNNLSQALIDEINKVGTIRKYRKNMPAMSADETMKYFYIVLTGRIKVYQYNPQNNREQTLYLLGHGW